MAIAPSAVESAHPDGVMPGLGVDHCIVQRADGVYANVSVLGTTLAAAVDAVFTSERYFAGLDYAILLKLIYHHDADPASAANIEVMLRLADAIVPFEPERRQLYKSVKMSDGKADYQFEPVVIVDPADPYGPGTPGLLTVDEFIADMWSKGIRFGIDTRALQAQITASKTERVTVARRLDPVAGSDAFIAEVSSELHRSDAPRRLANGKLDLLAFQNRFPQIKQGVRLLQKVPRRAGQVGFQLSGLAIEPATPRDIDLAPMAGSGTAVEISADGEFLIATQSGFLNADSKTHQLSIGDKIVSRDGVSSRTTGNLQLSGDYEEFGEVQEKRVIEGDSVTIHADVFGNVISRGGTILLNHNLVGGSAHNARGDVRIKGVASGAVIQTSFGEVLVQRAESCIISGTRVVIEHAANCEIMADEVLIKQAEGCTIAARCIEIEVAGPRKQTDMQLFVLEPDSERLDQAIAVIKAKASDVGAVALLRRSEMEAHTSDAEVRKYVMLAGKLRKNALTLSPEQTLQFHRMGANVAPALKAIAKASLDIKTAEIEQHAAELLIAQLLQQRAECVGISRVNVSLVTGDTALRSIKFNPDGSTHYDLPAKEIKARLRGNAVPSEFISSNSSGKIVWQSK